jgi:hypothetical protein
MPNHDLGGPPPRPSTIPEKIGEPVRIAVDFVPANAGSGPKVTPLAFVWGGRKYRVQKLNLRYKRQLGHRWVWCFAVSDEANSYVLQYDPETLGWLLEEVYIS